LNMWPSLISTCPDSNIAAPVRPVESRRLRLVSLEPVDGGHGQFGGVEEGRRRGRREHMLAIVEDDQHPAALQEHRYRFDEIHPRLRSRANHFRDNFGYRIGRLRFTTAGDSFAVAFSRASDAVAAAEAAQAALAEVSWPGPALRVRMGLHLGESEERGGDYFGPVVNLTARLEAAGHSVGVEDLLQS